MCWVNKHIKYSIDSSFTQLKLILCHLLYLPIIFCCLYCIYPKKAQFSTQYIMGTYYMGFGDWPPSEVQYISTVPYILGNKWSVTQWRWLLILQIYCHLLSTEGWIYLYGYLHCRYLVICHPMKAQYISTSGRAKKIIATIWMAAISLSCVIVPFVIGVSIGRIKMLFGHLTLVVILWIMLSTLEKNTRKH